MNAGKWVFGYGSLIWRPDFDFLASSPANIDGWQRRFWQASHDHRGTPENPGRVVTLVPVPGKRCSGMAYLVSNAVLSSVFEQLDYREKNGYERIQAEVELAAGESVNAVTYLASKDNPAYAGEATAAEIAQQVSRSRGPSGSNTEYVLELAGALRALDMVDEHVFDIERRLLSLHGGQDE